MNDITIENEDSLEKNPDDFEFVLKFSNLFLLTRTYLERNSTVSENMSKINRIISTSDFHLMPSYYYDFSQDNPHVGLRVLVDDDQYVEYVGQSSELEKSITSVFERVNPNSVSLSTQIYPKSLQASGKTQWRNEPQYQLGEHHQIVSQQTVERIWGIASSLHVFISHKVGIKDRAYKLKELLSEFGVIGFVAHEDIEPTQEWQDTIEKALFSSDVLIALLTVDFSQSNWTDQEVGIAFGRQLPVFPVKMDRNADPYGFIGKIQAFKLTDDVIRRFVEKFLDDERTIFPTINSLLTVLKNTSNPNKVDEFCQLLSGTNEKMWRMRQKEIFREIFKSNHVVNQSGEALMLLDRLAPPKTPVQSFGALDDEIPF